MGSVGLMDNGGVTEHTCSGTDELTLCTGVHYGEA